MSCNLSFPSKFVQLLLFVYFTLLFGTGISDQGSVSISYCSTYLCSRFSNSVTAYFKEGCEGSFEDFLVTKNGGTNEFSAVSPRILTLLTIICGLGGIFCGYYFESLNKILYQTE